MRQAIKLSSAGGNVNFLSPLYGPGLLWAHVTAKRIKVVGPGNIFKSLQNFCTSLDELE